MCGIVGVFAVGNKTAEEEAIRQEVMRILATELMLLTIERGKDATGASILFDDGHFYGLKMGIPVVEFIARTGGKTTDFEGFINMWRGISTPGRVFIGHCRKSSVGNSTDNENNHPIKVGDIVGVHNGTLQNHHTIFTKLGCARDGEVDSEAIFRLIHHFTKNGKEPFTTELVTEIARRLQGTFSVLSFSGNNPFQVIGMKDQRPFDMALIKSLGIIIVSSEKKYTEQAFYNYNKISSLYSTIRKLPTIYSKDTIFQYLQDDHVIVFDLTTNVNSDSLFSDTYAIKKYAYIDKIWKVPYNYKETTVEPTGKYHGTTGVGAVGKPVGKELTDPIVNKKPDLKVLPGKTDKSKNEKVEKAVMVAMLFNKEVGSFVELTKEEIEQGKIIKNVSIDVTAEEIPGAVVQELEDIGVQMDEKVSTKDESVPPLTVKDNVDETELLSVLNDQTSYEEEKLPAPVCDAVIDSSKTVVVDMIIDPTLSEKAMQIAEESEKFASNKEVVEALGIVDETTLNSLPLYALANRIKRISLQAGFYLGATTTKNKSKISEHIRTLKIIHKIGIEIKNRMIDGDVTEKSPDKMTIIARDVTREFFVKKDSVTKEQVLAVYNSGEINGNVLLHTIFKAVTYCQQKGAVV